MEIVLGLLAVLVVSGLVAAFIASRPRRRGTDLEPPPAAPTPEPPRQQLNVIALLLQTLRAWLRRRR